MLAMFTPILGELALKFGAYEFFWLAVFGVVIAGTLTGDDPLKGYIAGFLGLFVATSARSRIYAYQRFAFGNRDLAGGIQLVPALVGAFGFAEVLTAMRERRAPVKVNPFDTVIPKLRDVTQVLADHHPLRPDRHRRRHRSRRRRGRRRLVVLCRGQAGQQGAGEIRQGFDRGPDGGRDRRQRLRSRRDDPGADTGGPGSAPAAVLMAAMIIHGVQPGPMMMIEHPQFIYDVVAMMLFATIGILIYGLTLTRLLVMVLRVPQHLIVPIIFVLCAVGSFAIAAGCSMST